MDTPEITLPQHETASQARADHLGAKIDSLKEKKMGQPVNVFTTPTGGDAGGAVHALPLAMMAGGMNRHSGMDGVGGGLGAGLVGGLLGGLLFGGRGFGNAAVVDGGVNTAAIELGTARVAFDTVAMQSLNNITALIPTATGLVADKVNTGNMQLMNAIGAGFASQGQMTLQQTIMTIQQLNMNQQTLLTELCGINTNVSAQGCMTREAVMNDGEKTRALLTSQYETNLQRQLGVAEVALLESNRRRDHDAVIAQITNTNTAVAAQAQGQQQQQQQAILSGISQLFPILQGITQIAHATNGNVIAGNTGAVTTGAQTSTPTNVNA